MAALWTDQGLSDALRNMFGIGSADPIDALGVSDFGSLAAGTTSIAAATNKLVKAFDSTPTESSKVVTTVTTFLTSEANFTITTITFHNDGAATNTGVAAGVDGQSIGKTSSFSLAITLKASMASA